MNVYVSLLCPTPAPSQCPPRLRGCGPLGLLLLLRREAFLPRRFLRQPRLALPRKEEMQRRLITSAEVRASIPSRVVRYVFRAEHLAQLRCCQASELVNLGRDVSVGSSIG